MAWTYNDYESQSGNTAKLTRLELHITEVSAEVGPNLGINDRSRGNQPLVDYLEMLQQRRKELVELVGETISPDSARARSMFVRARPI